MTKKILVILAMLVNVYADEPIVVSKTIDVQKEKLYTIEKALQIQEKAILLLIDENKNLRDRVLRLENGTVARGVIKEETTNQLLFKVVKKKGIKAFLKPYCNCKVINHYKYNEQLQVEYCNNRKWCKLKGKDEYVKKYLLKSLKQ